MKTRASKQVSELTCIKLLNLNKQLNKVQIL